MKQNQAEESGEVGDGGSLLFRWRDDAGRTAVRLSGFVLLSVAVHIGFFYAVRVVEPPSVRVLPREAHLILLHPTNGLAAPLLANLEDRLSAVESALVFPRENEPDLEDAGVAYVPSFSGFEPALLDWPTDEASGTLPELDLPAEWELPAVSPAAPPVIAPTTQAPAAPDGIDAAPTLGSERIAIEFSGGLAERDILSAPPADPSLVAGTESGGSGEASFVIGVGSGGRVEACFPLERGGLITVQPLTTFLQAIRFAPNDAAQDPQSLDWGRVHVRW